MKDNITENKATDFNSEEAYRQFVSHWQSNFGNNISISKERLLEQTPILDDLSQTSGTFYAIVDLTNLDLLFFTQNLEALSGYKAEELHKNKFKMLYNILPWRYLTYPIKLAGFYKDVCKEFPVEERLNGFTSLSCGVPLIMKNGKTIKTEIKFTTLEVDKKGDGLIALYGMQEITQIYKPENYWIRFTTNSTPKKVRIFYSETNTFKREDIVSPREIEVLERIGKGLSTKEIAQELFLSPATVEQHRKNMLARTGFTNTSSLSDYLIRHRII
jgi:DNA-binding CsgD family transcriptional regulator